MSRAGRHLAPCVLLVLVGALLYGRVLGYGFVQYDDHEFLVLQYGSVVQLADPVHAFTRDAFAALGPRAEGIFYRPLLVLLYGLEARVAGPSPALFHATNLVLHLVATLLAYAFLLCFGAGRWLAAGLAAVFCCHPASALVAAWIPGRNDSLLAIAALTSLLALVAFLRRGSRGALALSVGAFGAALFTKESGGALLAMLALALALEGPLPPARRRPLALAGAGAGLAVVLWALARRAVLGDAPIGVSHAAGNLGGLLVYLGKTFVPAGLAPVPHPADSALGPGIAAALGLAVAIAASADRLRGPAGFGLAWYAAFLLPALLTPRATWGLEYRLYLPLIGMLLFVSTLRAPARWQVTGLGTALAFAVAAAFAGVTHARLPDFAGPIAYWESAARNAPHSSIAASRVAWRYYEALSLDDALAAADRALALDPDDAEMHLLRGIAFAKRGDLRRAEPALERALALDPENAHAWSNLARLHRLLGREEQSRRAQREAERLR